MERVQSLIHKIQFQHETGVAADEMLETLEQLRRELIQQQVPVDNTRHAVSVLLPPGYRASVPPVIVKNEISLPEKEISSEKREESLQEDLIQHKSGMTDLNSNPAYRSAEIPDERTPEAEPVENILRTPLQSMGAPKPPVAPVWEDSALPEINAGEEMLSAEAAEVATSETKTVQPEKKMHQSELFWDAEQEKDIEEEAEDPLVFELQLEDEPEEKPVAPAAPALKPHSIIPEGFLNMGSTRKPAPAEPEVAVLEIKETLKEPVLEAPAKTRDLNELLAGRVVAKKEPILKEEGVKVLADRLGGSKISDLRKAISINDRFRFIHSLFRNDEITFERAVKTINNFSILQEAQYWIQRELVIKLGWNEEDELVQQFYHLVSRRFL